MGVRTFLVSLKKTSLLRRLLTQTLPDAASKVCKIHPFIKIAYTNDLLIRHWVLVLISFYDFCDLSQISYLVFKKTDKVSNIAYGSKQVKSCQVKTI